MALGNITLAIGEVTQTVSVDAVAPPIDTNSMDKAYLVDQQQISQLPMNGRNWIALMSTVPGMSSSAQSDFNVNFNDVSQFHGLGGRGSENNFYLDGSPNVDVGDNQSQYTQPSIDSLSASSASCRAPSTPSTAAPKASPIAVQTKSGTASSTELPTSISATTTSMPSACFAIPFSPRLRYNQFGGNVGGWLWIPKISTPQNKKIFFFYNREMTRRNLPGSDYADVPNAQILSGDFSPWIVPGSKMPVCATTPSARSSNRAPSRATAPATSPAVRLSRAT